MLCSITAIRAEDDRMTFRRLTGLAETRGTTWSHFRGDHEGVVLERFNWFYFLGLNQRDPKEPTFMSVQWGPFSPETLLCGHAMIFAHRAVDNDGGDAGFAEGNQPEQRVALGKGLRRLGSGSRATCRARLQRQVHADALSRARLFQRL